MRRTIVLSMTVFLLGLIAAVVGVSTWKFTLIRNTITAERDGNVALFRLGGQAQNEVQALEMAVETLFKATSASDVDSAKKKLDQHLSAFTDAITTIQDPRFIAPLSANLVLADGTPGEPLQKSVDVLLAGKDALKSAVAKVAELANTRLELHAKLVGAKNDLSKVARKTMDLNAIDTKAYSSLMRGIIATVSTDSPADLKFVGLKIYEDSYATLTKATLSDDQKNNLTALNTQYMATYEIVRQYLSTGNDADA